MPAVLDHPSLIPQPADQRTQVAPIPDKIDFGGGITLTRERYLALCDFLHAEIEQAEQDTAKFRKNIILWRDFVDPEDKQKSFPWTNSSNVFVPFPRIVLDALKASAKQAITRQRETWTVEITSKEDVGLPSGDPATAKTMEHDLIRAFVDFCEKVTNDPGYLRFKSLVDNWLDEMITTGIGYVKAIREPLTRTVRAKGPFDKGPTKQQLVLRRGPHMVVPPTGTMVWPAGIWESVQEMPWVGNWVVYTAPALQERKRGRGYLFTDEVLAAGADNVQEVPDAASRLDKTGQAPATLNGIRVFDIYIDWDLEGDGKDLSSLVVKYAHRASRVMKVEYGDGWKPYDYEVASVRSGMIPGRGFIEPIVQPCRAINTAVNQTFDAQTLANAPCLIYPETSAVMEVLEQDGGFYPGMGLPYKETKDEFDILQFPAPTATSFVVVNFFQTIISHLTRIGPQRLGEVSEGRRVPATLGMSSQQIGGELIDEMIDRIRDSAGRVMSRYLMLLYVDQPTIFELVLGPERGNLVREVVKKSIERRSSLEELVRIRLSASSGTRSVELERQNAMATAQMTQAWFKDVVGLVNLYSQTPDGPGRAILLDILKASELQQRRLVELANQADAETIVPLISEKMGQIPPPAPPQPTMGPEGGPGGMAAPPPALGPQLPMMGEM
jgi:hypothetical protein